jgi:hypothetical protein
MFYSAWGTLENNDESLIEPFTTQQNNQPPATAQPPQDAIVQLSNSCVALLLRNRILEDFEIQLNRPPLANIYKQNRDIETKSLMECINNTTPQFWIDYISLIPSTSFEKLPLFKQNFQKLKDLCIKQCQEINKLPLISKEKMQNFLRSCYEVYQLLHFAHIIKDMSDRDKGIYTPIFASVSGIDSKLNNNFNNLKNAK